MKIIPLLVVFIVLTSIGHAQSAHRTVGLHYVDSLAEDGYVLLDPMNDSTVYLLDRCGNAVHSWSVGSKPAYACKLLMNGDIVRLCHRLPSLENNTGNGAIQRRTWDNELIWDYVYPDYNIMLHHSIDVLPNGNVLVIAGEQKTRDDVILAGKSFRTPPMQRWVDAIYEIKQTGPTSGEVVWEWHIWDHLVQNFNPALPTYGEPSSKIRQIDLNYPFFGMGSMDPDWTHANSVYYNADLDQIIFSVHNFHEFWIIDHSTTLAEAAGSTGGRYGVGGDLLYRWGNPAAYSRGDLDSQQLFAQHDAHWIQDGLPGAGSIMVFNNGVGRLDVQASSIDVISPPIASDGSYTIPLQGPFAPSAPDWIYQSNPPQDFFSNYISGAHRLKGGGTFICAGASGHLFEVGPDGNIHWSYINPVTDSGTVKQGDFVIGNPVFQAVKYPLDYPAFAGRTFNAGTPIELSPWPMDCTIDTVATSVREVVTHPFDGPVRVFDLFGNEIFRLDNTHAFEHIRRQLTPGVYLLVAGDKFIGKELVF